MALAAVITADIVNSTRLEKAEEKKLLNILSAILKPYKFEFYRGDSFQVYIPDAENALKVVLQTRAAAKRLNPEVTAPLADVRASIGIGSTDGEVKNLKTAGGEAFLLSGRAFDSMGKLDPRLIIRSPDENINLGLKIAAGYMDSLFSSLTSKQAGVLYEMLSGHNQLESAKRLKKSQATINKHVQAAQWPEINTLLQDYQMLVRQLSNS
ncbi:nucleotidyl cyclase domain-containing protein [Flavitalea flava]